MTSREIHPLRTTETLLTISNADVAVNTSYFLRIAQYLLEFDNNHHSPSFNAVDLLKKICELMEEVIDIYLNNDPDPLDDRHPHRTHPDSAYGTVLKIMFKNDNFMTKLVVSYLLHRENVELNIQGCRLLLACIPGLDSKVVFSEPEEFVPRLYDWAKDGSNETLQGYAMGLLASALDNPENASKYRNLNATMVPFAINLLRQLEYRMVENQRQEKAKQNERVEFSLQKIENEPASTPEQEFPITDVPQANEIPRERPNNVPPPPKKRKTEPCLQNLLRTELAPRVPSVQNLRNLDESNSKWDIMQPFIIGNQQIYPPSLATFQRFVFQYLASCGEYQDLLYQTFEGNALQLLLDYMDLEKTQDVKVTFDALKYLTSLLVHRKFALEFAKRGGIEVLLRIPRDSLASVGVVTAFYYIAYSSDVCEFICQMPEESCDAIVEYVLWCLEHSYESGMASACLFFSQTLFYKAILRRFDLFDGPRKLYNYLSTLSIMQLNDVNLEMTEEQVHTSTQCVRGVCSTFKNYMSAHIFQKVESLKKAYGNHLPTGQRFPELVQGERSHFKSMKDYEEVSWECENIVLEMFRATGDTWKEAENMRKLGMVRMFLSVRMHAKDWLNITTMYRNEMCVNAFESLSKLMCYPPIQVELIPEHLYPRGEKFEGFSILIQTSLGHYDEEGSLRVAALGSIQRCIVIEQESLKFWKEFTRNPTRQQREHHNEMRRHMEKMWHGVRKCDGLHSLIKLVNCKIPVIEADSIRFMAAKCLAGLARNAEVRQILTKLPIIAQSQLLFLMREPVCSDKRSIHAAFCKEAMLLLQVVTGRKHHDPHADPKSIHDVRGQTEKAYRQWVIENTKVKYNGTELLQLIHEHLAKSGLSQAAAALKTEAKLPDQPASLSSITPITMAPWPCITKDAFTKMDIPTLAPRILESSIGGSVRRQSQMPQIMSSPVASRSLSTDNDDAFATPTLPRRNTNSNFPKKLAISPATNACSWKRKPSMGTDLQPVRDLDNIMVEYFRNQHSSCKNPVTTCPEFSLFYPHKCPERTPKTPVRNLSSRILDQFDILAPNQRIVSQWNNERHVYSKFRSVRTVHDHDESYTAATFSIDDEHLIVGFFNGELHWINVETGVDEGHTTCHHSAIGNIEQSQDGSMICTSSMYVKPLSALWRLGETMQRMHSYREATCLKFANTTTSRIIGTYGSTAIVYDTETNIIVKKYESPGVLYETRNFASFSPDDNLVFNDGHLWDVRKAGKNIHTFERLNNKTQFGVFHPHGTQIIINTEVYDIRNFRLMHHVPELNQCSLKFNSTGNIMFATELHELLRDDFPEMVYSSFRTFDTRDYSSLTTVEGRRPVLDLCNSHRDQKLCVVEQNRPSVGTDYMVQAATHLRLIEIGRKKDHEDDGEEDDDEPREEHEEEDETDSEDEQDDDDDDDMEGTLDRSRSPNRSVFEALGRLGEESDDESSNEMDVEDVINRMMRNANRRNRQNLSPLMQRLPDRIAEEGDEELVAEAAANLRAEVENGAEEAEEEDPDFDVGAAMDELMAQVDDELLGDGDSDSDGTWETASQIGSDDINLDDMNEEEARAAESGELLLHPQEHQHEQQEAVDAPTAAQNLRRSRRAEIGEVARQLIEEIDEHLGLPGQDQPQQSLLSARIEEQRAQMMEAYREQNPERPPRRERYDYGNDPHYGAEEEEILSVSSCTLNPMLRRRQRRPQNDDDDSSAV